MKAHQEAAVRCAAGKLSCPSCISIRWIMLSEEMAAFRRPSKRSKVVQWKSLSPLVLIAKRTGTQTTSTFSTASSMTKNMEKVKTVNKNTKKIRDLAAYVCDRLDGKVLIHRYDAYSTNSVYLKFDYGVANSLRIADHAGKKHLAYRFNIILNLTEPKNDLSGRFPRNYYPPDMVDQVIEDILAGAEAKRARYRNYEKVMESAKEKAAHERGFWEQARLVKTEEKK